MFKSISHYLFKIIEICSIRHILRWFLAFLFGFGTGLAFVLFSAQLFGSPYENAGLHRNHSSYMTAKQNIVIPSVTNMTEDLIATQLAKEVRVLCWIMTDPVNHQRKASVVRDTWGKRCNILLFMTTQDDPSLGNTVKLPVEPGYKNLWNKTKEAFKYVYKHHFNDADWFMKADDDTYVFLENLRYFLHPYSTEYPIYFGYKFKIKQRLVYMSGGAGYVLSKEALRRFVVEALPDKKNCSGGTGGPEDLQMGKCLKHVNVIAGDSRDNKKGRFFIFSPTSHLFPSKWKPDSWYPSYAYYPLHDGLDCCSETAISFHYVNPKNMRLIEYLVYQLRPFGLKPNNSIILQPKLTLDEIKTNLKLYMDRLPTTTLPPVT